MPPLHVQQRECHGLPLFVEPLRGSGTALLSLKTRRGSSAECAHINGVIIHACAAQGGQTGSPPGADVRGVGG